MNKKEAINFLAEEDIKNVLKYIEEKNIKIIYWNDEPTGYEANKWFIDDVNIYDFLSYYLNLNLHWSALLIPLTDVFKDKNLMVIK